MGKLYREMTDEEKVAHKARTSRYLKEHPEVARKAALNYYYRNKEKAAEKAKTWREANLAYVKEKQRENKRRRKLEAIEYLGGKCQMCEKHWHPSQYEFHHIDPTTKDRDPSKMLQLSKEKLFTELDKCQLLCANCHRYIHHGSNY